MTRPNLAVTAVAVAALIAIGSASVAMGAEGAGGGQKILVFAAASTTNALDEIRAAFHRETGIDVQASYASSATLAQQIVHGADADLFLSADVKWADYLAKKDLVAKRQDLLANRLVIIVPADSRLKLKRPEDLASPAVEHLAMGDPQGVPAGKYARQALEKLGLWDSVRGKAVPGADVRQALSFVETGAAEAGIVYATDAAVSRKVRVAAEIPKELTEPIRYPLVLLRGAQTKDAALRFYRHLSSPAAAGVFRKYGFEVLAAAADPAKEN
jgi:molybdate transport system substrate-binding protein